MHISTIIVLTFDGGDELLELDTLPNVGLFSTEDRLLAGFASSVGDDVSVSDLRFNEFELVVFGVVTAAPAPLMVVSPLPIWLTTRLMLNVDLRTLLAGAGGKGGGDVTSSPLRRSRIVAPFSITGANMDVA